MRLFKLTIELLSPAIIAAEATERGMVFRGSSAYVPAIVVLGSLMKALIGYDRPVRIRGVGVTPALYAAEGRGACLYRDVAFAHALSFHSKGQPRSERGGEYVFGLPLDDVLNAKDSEILGKLREALRELELTARQAAVNLMQLNPADLKPAGGVVVNAELVRGSTLWRRVQPKAGVYVENFVDRYRLSARAGVLYAYEFVEKGATFTGLICLSDDAPAELTQKLKRGAECEVAVGKGTGRGFGRARATLKELDLDAVVQRRAIKEKRVALVVYAPAFALDRRGLSRQLREGDEIATATGNRLTVKAVLGAKKHVYRGWSQLYNSVRATIQALAPGSLLIAEAERELTLDDVVSLQTGLALPYMPGFNTFHVLAEDFLPTLGEVLSCLGGGIR